MQGIPSGGGSDHQHRATDDSAVDPDDRLHDRFGAPGTADGGEGFDRGAADRDPPSASTARVDRQFSKRRQAPRLVRRWTAATVALALLSALSFGYLSVTTGSTLAAFAAGLLVGLGTLFLGMGGAIDVLVAVQ